MAYDTQEERLKVRGSEQITRDLKVNRDLFVMGNAKIGNNDVLTTADKGVSNGVATLDATGRVPYNQLPESAMEYKGTWDASTNTPALTDGTGTNGDFYVVSVGGTVTFSAGRSITFYVNDRVIYDGTLHEWERLPAGEVRSVNGQTGDVTLTASDINYDSNTTVKAEIDTKADSASLATVATTGDYNDLLNKPSIIPVDSVTDGNMNPVTSNAVYDALLDKVSKAGDTVTGVIKPSSDKGCNFGDASNRFHYGYFYRLFGLQSISNDTSSGNLLMLPSKSGTLATLDDVSGIRFPNYSQGQTGTAEVGTSMQISSDSFIIIHANTVSTTAISPVPNVVINNNTVTTCFSIREVSSLDFNNKRVTYGYHYIQELSCFVKAGDIISFNGIKFTYRLFPLS